jgi:hypothetical protein
MFKQYVIVMMLSLSLVGCGKVDRLGAALTGSSRLCVDGVVYLQFTSGASVAYSPDGKIQTCK